jgi:hypothetical protein
MTLSTNNEEDSLYFYGTQNQLATIHMNKPGSNSTLDSYLIRRWREIGIARKPRS